MDKLSKVSFSIDGGAGWMGYNKIKNGRHDYIHFYIKDGFNFHEALNDLVYKEYTDAFATNVFPVDLVMHKSEKNEDECVVEILFKCKDHYEISNFITTNDDFNKYSYWEYLAANAHKKVKNGLLLQGTYDDYEEVFYPAQTYEEFMKTYKPKKGKSKQQ